MLAVLEVLVTDLHMAHRYECLPITPQHSHTCLHSIAYREFGTVYVYSLATQPVFMHIDVV